MIKCPQGTTREQGDTIRAALQKLPLIKVEEESYLKLEDALNATEAILYPSGLQTEEEYRRLVAISKAGCKAIGYGEEEITLLPPIVDFGQRGTYLKKMAIITPLISKLLPAKVQPHWVSPRKI